MEREKMSTEIQTYQPKPQALAIQSVGDVKEMGLAVAQSGMFGSCTPGRGAVIAAICQQEGYSLLEFKRTFHITNRGDVSMRADRMLAEFQRRGGTWKWVRFDAEEARAIISWRENENVEVSYTIAEAKAAGLIKADSAWEKDPAAMLRARLITRGVRMVNPGAVCGTYTPEELADVYGVDVTDIEPREPVPVAATAERVQEAVGSVTTPWGETDTTPAPAEFDPGVCPVRGKLYGVRWADMDIDTLQIAKTLESPDMEPEHFEAINAAIAERENSTT